MTDRRQPVPQPGNADTPDVSRTFTYLSPGRGRSPSDGLDGTAIKKFLYRRKWSILLGFFGVLLVAGFVTYLLPPRYESSATFLVEQESQRGSSEAFAVLDRLGQVRNTETEIELLQGRRAVEPAVDSLDLHVRFVSDFGDRLVPSGGERRRPAAVFSGFDADTSAEPGVYHIAEGEGSYRITGEPEGKPLARGEPGTRVDFAGIALRLPEEVPERHRTLRVLPFSKAVARVRGRISAERVQRQADLVQLNCTGPTAVAARELCATVKKSYLDLRSQLQRSEASAAASFLDDQVRRVRQRLTAAEDSLQNYKAENRAVALEKRATESVENYTQLKAKYSQLRSERRSLAALIEEIEQGDPEPAQYRRLASFPTFLQNNQHIVSNLVESLVELENRRSDLSVTRTSKNPELAAVDERIREIERQLLDVADSYRQSLDVQIKSLRQEIEADQRELSTIPERQVETARLERRVSTLEDLYGFLRTRLQEAEVAEAVTLPSVRIVDQPSLPAGPSFPNTRLNLALGAILGLGTGLLGALWREYTDDRLRDRDDIEAAGIPVLSMVPSVKSGLLSVESDGDERRRILPASQSDDASDREQVAEESFRTLAFELDVAGERIQNGALRSVAVTSSTRSEGKTFCACNLAVQAAWMGKRTLLIDGDLRARGVERWLRLPDSQVGLRHLLHVGDDPGSAIQRVGIGEKHGLFVLPAGRKSGAPPFLFTEGVRRLVEKAASEFDLVVVDTPPLNVLSDAGKMARSVDGVAVVVRGGVTQRESLSVTLSRLERAGANIAGIVLNDVALPDYYASYSGSKA